MRHTEAVVPDFLPHPSGMGARRLSSVTAPL